MRVTKVDPFIGSKQVNRACLTRPVADQSSTAMVEGLRTAFNSFSGVRINAPLTVQTVSDMQDKFWSSPSGIQAVFCSSVWKCLEQVASALARNKETKSPISVANSKWVRKPVVFSTREGLGIDLELKSTSSGLEVLRTTVSPAGCSVNVARALNNFGTPHELIGLYGYGVRSEIFTELLVKEGVGISGLVETGGDIRFFFCTFIDGKEYWVVSQSPALTPSELSRLANKLIDAMRSNRGQVLALAHLPPLGAANSYMTEVVKEANEKFHMFVIYDTKLRAVGRELLDSILSEGVGMIKPNLAEYAEIVGIEEEKLREDKDLMIHKAQELTDKYGLKMILISLDEDGAVLVDKKRAALAVPPKVEVACTVGAGDAGIAAMINRGKERHYSFKKPTDKQFKDFLSAFVAGGCATVIKSGTELATKEGLQRVEKEVQVEFV